VEREKETNKINKKKKKKKANLEPVAWPPGNKSVMDADADSRDHMVIWARKRTNGPENNR